MKTSHALLPLLPSDFMVISSFLNFNFEHEINYLIKFLQVQWASLKSLAGRIFHTLRLSDLSLLCTL